MKRKDRREKFVTFTDDATKEAFDNLKEGKFEDKQLYNFINRALDDMKENPFVGMHIPSKQWPREYVQKYKINNLWKYDLPDGWRLIYTIKGTKIKIVAIVLEWLSHKDYERKFKYKRS